MRHLLQEEPGLSVVSNFHLEQKDPELKPLFACLEHGELHVDCKEAQKIIASHAFCSS